MTEYVRSTSIASYQVVAKGNQATFTVNDVSSSITLPTSATIALRQKSTLTFVTITNGETSASVTINATSVTTGTYTLILESYDSSASSLLQTTLKTDTITLYVANFSRYPTIASVQVVMK